MRHAIRRLTLVACLALIGCSPAEPVRIGFLAGMSGRIADLSEAARNGVLLAIEQRNREGGIDGRPIELVIRDDGESAETAAAAAGELIDSSVVAIIGPITSTMAAAALPVVDEAEVPMVSPTVTSMQLVGKDDYLFRMNATTRDYARMYAKFHYQRTGLRRAAIAMDVRNRAFTQSWLDEFEPAFGALGGEITAVAQFESSATVVFRRLVEQLVQSDPDGLLFIAGTVDVARLAQQARLVAPELPLIAVEWAASDKLHELGGSAVEGLRVSRAFPTGARLHECQRLRCRHGSPRIPRPPPRGSESEAGPARARAHRGAAAAVELRPIRRCHT